jgi:hypothetical protein
VGVVGWFSLDERCSDIDALKRNSRGEYRVTVVSTDGIRGGPLLNFDRTVTALLRADQGHWRRCHGVGSILTRGWKFLVRTPGRTRLELKQLLP